MDYLIRNLPDDLHRTWKSLSAMKGVTMQDYVLMALMTRIKEDLGGQNVEESLRDDNRGTKGTSKKTAREKKNGIQP